MELEIERGVQDGPERRVGTQRRVQEVGVYPKVRAEDLLDHSALLKGVGEAERCARSRVRAAASGCQ